MTKKEGENKREKREKEDGDRQRRRVVTHYYVLE